MDEGRTGKKIIRYKVVVIGSEEELGDFMSKLSEVYTPAAEFWAAKPLKVGFQIYSDERGDVKIEYTLWAVYRDLAEINPEILEGYKKGAVLVFDYRSGDVSRLNPEKIKEKIEEAVKEDLKKYTEIA